MRTAAATYRAAPLPIAERAPSSGGPVRFLLLVTAVTAPFVIASILDVGGLRVPLDNVHWNLSAIGATAAAIWSVRGTTGRVRSVRIGASAALALWAIS